MQKVSLACDERSSFPWKGFLMLTAFALALLAAPVRGQDDNGAPPPPPDNGAPPAMDNGDNGAPAPDDANGAPDDNASFQTFYDSLGSQGTWIQSSDYGYVWQPQVTDPDWAPYTEGHWVYTDDGWTWVSDEPWGWATYHYGRWVNLNGTGWCWVPGYTWAPAWVSWRYGGGYCGWAPLPPDSFVGIDYSDDGFAIGIGFHIGGDCDGFYGIGPGCYIFLPVNCLGYRSYHGYYHNRGDNFAIINHTTNVTNINVTRNGANSGVTTGGPMLAQVNAVSQTPIERVNLVRAHQPGGGGTLTANSLALYTPRVNPGGTAQPSRVAGSIGPATINHGIDITRPLAVNARLAPVPATTEQVEQARIARDHAPASAKVVTNSALVKPVLQTPLTSLKPVARQETPSSIFNPSPNTISNAGPVHSPQVVPTVRTYPQTSEEGNAPSHVYYPPATVYPPGSSTYQPHSTATETGGATDSHQYVRPATPVYSPPAPAATSTHPSAGGNSGGSGGNSNGGGSSHTQSGGGNSGSGGYHGGGANGGNYQQQGQSH
jgi:uncharacterized membrane protein YgcG